MKLGLTGGIGCGKSTVVALFQQAGWRTVGTDAVVADLLEQDAEVRAELRRHWGATVFLDGGSVDRQRIAAKVFSDEAELRWLEKLLHPRVREVWQGAVDGDPAARWLVEIPLLFEKRLESAFDFTVCVAAPSDVVEIRMAARGYTGEAVERRRRRQMLLEEKLIRADYVITNAGNLDFLKDQTSLLIHRLTVGTT